METKEKDNQVNDPIVVRTLKHSPDANENIPNTSAGTSFHTPSQLDVKTPLVHRDIIQSARSSESEHHFNSQIWRIQEENAEIQKTQVELLRRMTVPVPKPPVFDGNILEYPKWENAFDALIEDQVVRPNYKLYYLGEYMVEQRKKRSADCWDCEAKTLTREQEKPRKNALETRSEFMKHTGTS